MADSELSVQSQLQDMGFPETHIKAVLQQKITSLEEAIEWLEDNQDNIDNQQSAVEPNVATATQSSTDSTAKSTLSDQPPTTQTTEPASSEEPNETIPTESRLDELRRKAALRKAEQAKLDKENERKNELIRRKRSQESAVIKDELRHKEALKEAQRKRQQAKEDALQRQKIRDRIQADKEARKREREGNSASKPSPSQAIPATSTAPAPAAPRAAPTESKIRFRINGQPPASGFLKTYSVETTLSEVVASIQDEVQVNNIEFQTTFPTKTYGPEQFSKTLKELGLINTNLIIKKL
ncbi:hypothetical protein DV495_003885 [Geotrichum candidum]|nr:hypothetical protein DV452_004715 [Geotrichum candidum]KAI9210797.1 hypothetical protein DS838_004323 [Geotrichum bryndzae]KAF5111863.1 hypothetical protein DV454_004538 [Geotrichum candidum]KAF5124596.1 hypothetical protein DV495_003885 [Geotrichum candidum]KAF7499305.1 hypothetical protein DV113_002659 [Geotrichum candidum]